jgi:type VI secretion system protein ImpG
MRDALDVWYEREMEFLRNSCAEFAARFPKIAGRLTIGPAGVADPHVERLIQAFAFLNARTRLKLEDSFPEIVDGVINALYPHLLAPVPSMTILGFQLDPAQKELAGGLSVPKGSMFDSDRSAGPACRFRTSQNLKLLPIQLQSAELLPSPFPGPASPRRSIAAAALVLQLRTFDNVLPWHAIPGDSLRFYLHFPEFSKAAKLLEILCTQTLEIVVSDGQPGGFSTVLPAAALQPAGFSPDDDILPRSPHAFPGYGMLTEYFVLPRKFLFFELSGLSPQLRAKLGSSLHISFLLADAPGSLTNAVSRDNLRLNCSPAINLFPRTADAIPLNYRTAEYRVIADARAEDSLEIHSVNSVRFEDYSGQTIPVRPFYNSAIASEDACYWHAVRRPGPVDGDVGVINQPGEIYISLLDPHFSVWNPGQGLLYAELTCFNRSLPESIGRGSPGASSLRFSPAEAGSPVQTIECLTPPTPVCRRHLARPSLWPLISQLTLNHLSLGSGQQSLPALQEILALNDPSETAETRILISGLRELRSSPGVRRVGSGFVRGVESELILDDESYRGNNPWLFASVLNHFLSMYISINSFSSLTASTSERKARALESWSWPLQIGNRTPV